jgi:hypothetical protein
MEKLTKISLIISLTGIIVLLFLTQNIDFSLNGINNMTEENKDITIQGLVIKEIHFNNNTILTIKTSCILKGFSYNKKLQNLTNKEITIKGTIKETIVPEMYIENVFVN